MSQQKQTTLDDVLFKKFKADRFEYMNSGFAKATAGDHAAARELALRMLESAARMQDVQPVFKAAPQPQPSVNHSIW